MQEEVKDKKIIVSKTSNWVTIIITRLDGSVISFPSKGTRSADKYYINYGN